MYVENERIVLLSILDFFHGSYSTSVTRDNSAPENMVCTRVKPSVHFPVRKDRDYSCDLSDTSAGVLMIAFLAIVWQSSWRDWIDRQIFSVHTTRHDRSLKISY
jgi:hypothetical protein